MGESAGRDVDLDAAVAGYTGELVRLTREFVSFPTEACTVYARVLQEHLP